jgi:hypothetical protein
MWLGVKRYGVSPPRNEVEAALQDLVRKHFGMYGAPLGMGSSRFAFDRGDGYVVKVPHNERGLIANGTEANWDNPGIPLAECWLELDSEGAYYVLVMEKVDRYRKNPDDLPFWASCVDCYQVGYNRLNELVAYDL